MNQQLPVRTNPLQLDLWEPHWKRLKQKLDLVYYQCNMPVLENVHVTLAEALEVRGQGLSEPELWALLSEGIRAIEDLFLRGVAHKGQGPQTDVNPYTLSISYDGYVFIGSLSYVTSEIIELKRKFDAPEIPELDGTSDEDAEKIYVYSLGKTIQHAAEYGVVGLPKLSGVLRKMLDSMQQELPSRRSTLSNIIRVLHKYARKFMGGKPYSYFTAKVHSEVLDSLPETDILTQVDNDVAKEMRQLIPVRDGASSSDPLSFPSNNPMRNPSPSHVNVAQQWLEEEKALQMHTYGRRLEYRPKPLDGSGVDGEDTGDWPLLVQRESDRWVEVIAKLRAQRERQVDDINVDGDDQDPVAEKFAAHKAIGSITKVYEQLRERKRIMEILRLDVTQGCEPLGSDSSQARNLSNQNRVAHKWRRAAFLALQRNRSENNVEADQASQQEKNTGPLIPFHSLCNADETIPSSSMCPILETTKITAPEIVIRSCCDPVRLTMPSIKDSKQNSNCKAVTISLLNGTRLELNCNTENKIHEVFTFVTTYLNLRNPNLFGLSIERDGEHLFAPQSTKLSKLAPSGWDGTTGKPQIPNCPFTMFLRFKFYVATNQVKHSSTKHWLYLQLRGDVLKERIRCGHQLLLAIVALALQAELGDRSQNPVEYFQPEHYLPGWVIKESDREEVRQHLALLHANYGGMSKSAAKESFITRVQEESNDYGYHFYKVMQDKVDPSSAVTLGISTSGLVIFDHPKVHGEDRRVLQNYKWEAIQRLSYDKKHFFLTPTLHSLTGRRVKYRFYIDNNKGRYLVEMAMAHHELNINLCTMRRSSKSLFEDGSIPYHGYTNTDFTREDLSDYDGDERSISDHRLEFHRSSTRSLLASMSPLISPLSSNAVRMSMSTTLMRRKIPFKRLSLFEIAKGRFAKHNSSTRDASKKDKENDREDFIPTGPSGGDDTYHAKLVIVNSSEGEEDSESSVRNDGEIIIARERTPAPELKDIGTYSPGRDRPDGAEVSSRIGLAEEPQAGNRDELRLDVDTNDPLSVNVAAGASVIAVDEVIAATISCEDTTCTTPASCADGKSRAEEPFCPIRPPRTKTSSRKNRQKFTSTCLK